MLALNGGRPQVLTIKDIISAFTTFREDVITRRTVYLLGKAREQAHIRVGLAIAVANIEEVIALIRKAPDPNTAKAQLIAREWPAKDMAPFIQLIDEPGRGLSPEGTSKLSDVQAQAILELRLQRLTGLERDKIGAELKELAETIKDYLDILGSRPRRLDILRTELREVKEQFGTPRRTEIIDLEFEQDIEDLIQREDMVVTVTHGGYIKRVPLSSYRAQRRGGKGRAAMATRDEDFVTQLFVVNTHTPVLFFSTTGIAYKLKVYRLPLGTPQARGKALVNLLPLKEGETISTLMPLPEDEKRWDEMSVMFATDKGTVRRNKLSDFVEVKANGKVAMKLEEGDRLIAVQTCTENDDVLLAAAGGKSIRFPVNDVRVFTGRTSVGVRGIKLEESDHVISMSILRHVDADTGERVAYLKARRSVVGDESPVESDGEEAAEATISPERYAELEGKEEFILTVTSRGYGKRTSAYEYRIAGRGGQGIANMDITERNGQVVASFPVAQRDQIMLVTDRGQLIRCPVNDIRIAGRKTQGVTLFKVEEGERVVSVTRLSEETEDGGNGNGAANGANGAPEANGSDGSNGSGGAAGTNGADGNNGHG
jgi:DNA gyrase subunit A